MHLLSNLYAIIDTVLDNLQDKLLPDCSLRISAFPSVPLPARSFSISAIINPKTHHCPENKEHSQAGDELSK